MRGTVKLTNVHDIVLIFQDCSLIVVDIEVVGRTEDRHDTRETSRSSLTIHSIASVLRFVSPNDGEEIVLFQEGACRRV